MTTQNTQKDNTQSFTPEYRAQLTLTQPRCVVTITGSSPADVQNTVTGLLRGKTRFDAGQNERTILVFNDQHHDGEQPIGWIIEYQVPNAMSVRASVDHRIGLVERAA